MWTGMRIVTWIHAGRMGDISFWRSCHCPQSILDCHIDGWSQPPKVLRSCPCPYLPRPPPPSVGYNDLTRTWHLPCLRPQLLRVLVVPFFHFHSITHLWTWTCSRFVMLNHTHLPPPLPVTAKGKRVLPLLKDIVKSITDSTHEYWFR